MAKVGSAAGEREREGGREKEKNQEHGIHRRDAEALRKTQEKTEEKKAEQARRPALLGEGIPEAGSEVVEHRAAGRGVEEVAAAEAIVKVR